MDDKEKTKEQLIEEVGELRRRLDALGAVEEELRSREQEFKALVENFQDIIARIDRDMRFVYVNPQMEVLTGISAADFIGHTLDEVGFTELVCRELKENVRWVFTTRTVAVYEFSFTNRAHYHYQFHAQIIPEFAEDGRVVTVLCIMRDITERNIMQTEIARLDRLNLVGEMAAGIGHEVRNPMTTVRGFLQMLERKPACSQYREYFELMIRELDGANSIISEFLALAKDKSVHKQLSNLNSIIKKLLPMLEADGIMDNKYIETDLQDVPLLMVDQKEISQLILNLALNGLEAMSPGGNLNIRTFCEGGDVLLAIQDEGPGIEQAVMARLGTPFFTTKEKGTGLGLAVCYSIANRHNAAITIDTGRQGTTFFVRFKSAGAVKGEKPWEQSTILSG